MTRRVLFGAFGALLVAVSGGLALAEPWGPRWDVRHGVSFTVEHTVVDLAGRVAYARHIDGTESTIRAIRLRDGTELWASAAGMTPLFIEAGWLVALHERADRTTGVLLSSRDGSVVAECEGVPSSLRTGGGFGHSTEARGMRHMRAPFLWTSHRTWYGEGAAPTPEEEAAARSQSTHAFAARVRGRRCVFSPSQLSIDHAARRFGVERTREGGDWVFTVVGPRSRFEALRDPGLGNVGASVDGKHVIARRQVSQDGRIAYESTYFDVQGRIVARFVSSRSSGAAVFLREDFILELSSNAITRTDLHGVVQWNRGLATNIPAPIAPPASAE